MTYQHSNIRIFYVLAFLLLLFIGCEDQQQPFPYVRVDVTLNIDTELNNIATGQYVFIDPEDCSDSESCGYGGLIIYHNVSSYQAFDRACPYNPKEKCILEPFEGDKSNLILSCPCCGSLFDLGDNGRTIQGPATRRLQQYRVIESGSNQIVIRN